jgi:hypothetical protein
VLYIFRNILLLLLLLLWYGLNAYDSRLLFTGA